MCVFSTFRFPSQVATSPAALRSVICFSRPFSATSCAACCNASASMSLAMKRQAYSRAPNKL